MPRDPLLGRELLSREGGLNRTREVSRFKRILNISNGVFYALVCWPRLKLTLRGLRIWVIKRVLISSGMIDAERFGFNK